MWKHGSLMDPKMEPKVPFRIVWMLLEVWVGLRRAKWLPKRKRVVIVIVVVEVVVVVAVEVVVAVVVVAVVVVA